MRKNHEPKNPGAIRTAAYFSFIAIIVVNVVRSVLKSFADLIVNVRESRQSRR